MGGCTGISIPLFFCNQVHILECFSPISVFHLFSVLLGLAVWKGGLGGLGMLFELSLLLYLALQEWGSHGNRLSCWLFWPFQSSSH